MGKVSLRTKDYFVGILWMFACIIFFGVGFHDPGTSSLTRIALGFLTAGFLIDRFWQPSRNQE